MRTRLTRKEQVERNREALLAAAQRVFLTRGYGGATLDGIAEEAGFSKGVVYSQFDSKADLFFALLERRIDARAAQNEHAARSASSPRDVLLAVIRAAETDARAELDWLHTLIEFRSIAARDPVLNRRYASTHTRTVQQLTALLEAELSRTGGQSAFAPHDLAELILALGIGVVLERATDRSVLRRELVEQLVLSAALESPSKPTKRNSERPSEG